MKIRHLSVEIAHEVAKELVWDNQFDILHEDQLFIFAHQHRRVHRLVGKVDYIIVDCPLLMCIPYIPKGSYVKLEPLIAETWNAFDNVSFLLNRSTDIVYDERGRYQDEAGSKAKHGEIIAILDKYDVPYTNVDVDPDAPKRIVEKLQSAGYIET
jgi:hypothetical protein